VDLELSSKKFLNIYSISDFLQWWLNEDYLQGEQLNTFKNYYRSYVSNFGHYIKYQYGQQTKELFEELAEDKSKKILEVGCGCGTEALWLAMHGYSVTAVDVSDELLEVAKSRKIILEQYLGRDLPCQFISQSLLDITKNKYDVIWMEQTFHHLEPRDDVLIKLGELLHHGGRLVISETNGWNLAIQAQFFKGRGFNTVINHKGVQWGNERITTARNLVKSLQQNGIKKKSVRYFRIFPNKPWVDSLTYFLGVFDKHELGVIKPLYTHFNYVGVKD
jgi:2-polyprenyl-3-methyl-5-hydroxy-6-metoxy-1,4-benzoquinol methylase